MVRPINLNLSDEIYRSGKETSQIITRGEYKTILDKNGKPKGISFPDIIFQFTEKIIARRIELARDRIQRYLDKQAEQLFNIMLDYGINQTQNNFPASYGGKTWMPLGKKWVKYKMKRWGTKNFWMASGELAAWLYNADPTEVFGRPIIYTTINPNARSYQWGNFYIDLFPNLGKPNIGDEMIKYKLFGPRKTGAKHISNDQDRPILIPAVQWLLRKRIDRGVRKIFKEAVENG